VLVLVEFGVAHFKNDYIKLLHGLPACVAVPPVSRDAPLVFWFEGGDGLLMPFKKS
jgi:hypothetical protein